jgi:hypothetical protein
MTAPVVWEHYLIVLLIPLLYFAACVRQLNREARILWGAILVCCVGQTVEFTAWLAGRFDFSTWPALLAVSLFKSLPLILTGLFLMRCSEQWFLTYRTANWWALAKREASS